MSFALFQVNDVFFNDFVGVTSLAAKAKAGYNRLREKEITKITFLSKNKIS